MNSDTIEKFNKCRSWLYLSGYLSEAENEKCKARFEKEAKKAGIELFSTSILNRMKK